MGSCLSTHPSHATSFNGDDARASSHLSFGMSSGSKRWKDIKAKTSRKRKQKKKEKARRTYDDLDELCRISGRMFVNGSSDVACLFTQQGKKGTNQDAMIVWENFTSTSDTIFCGVFDGHGPYGHMVARKVRDSLPLKLKAEWNIVNNEATSPQHNCNGSGSMNSEESGSVHIDDEWSEAIVVDENVKLPDVYPKLRQSLLKAFKSMDKELKFHPTIDCFCSGTTAVTLVKQGYDLVIGNVGDSRAILGRRDTDNNLIAEQLTVDLKPNLPKEAARIQQCNGRVFALQDEPEVARVWLPNNDSPGLAMARAFGDFCLKDYGLISVPDISYRLLTDKDEFIVLATDGIWDVLSNKEVVDIIASAPTRATAARALVECAVRSWRLKYPTSKTDDCAAVCLFLNSPLISTHQTTEPIINKTNSNQEVEIEVKEQAHTSHEICEVNDEEEDEIVPVKEEDAKEKMPGRSQSTRSLADCMQATDEEEWSALEGVTRVNTLLNIPRFLPKDKGSTSRGK